MQLPRRVPWASLSELEQLCSWIYADETDLHSKQLAVNKVGCPLSPPFSPSTPSLTDAPESSYRPGSPSPNYHMRWNRRWGFWL